ncbi:MAG: type II secretion system F family protein [archaeon]
MMKKKKLSRAERKKIKEFNKKEKKRVRELRKHSQKLKEKKKSGKADEMVNGESVEKNVKKAKKMRELSRNKKLILYFSAVIIFSLLSGFLIYQGIIYLFVFMVSAVILLFVYFYIRRKLKKYNDIKKMEDAFPDFISLMASNLRAGMTVDKALLLSSRKEFAPLDKEINSLGKDILTGKEISKALLEMADRIKSDEIRKTVMLIISGIKSGGNLSVLLEKVSSNMRERIFVKKRAASNVLMYVIFIFFAVAFGAPILFGLSSVLVEVLAGIISSLPSEQTVSVNVPFALTSVNISINFIFYFVIVFVIATDVFASLVLGLVSKGQEREGLKYTIPLIVISLVMFFLSRFVVGSYFPNMF